MEINFKEIEKSVKKIWDKVKIYKTDIFTDKKKKYILDMFPYPSASGLHVGHWRGYILSDLIAKIFKMEGYEILHPMGFDSFGLPAENYAIKTGIHPKKSTFDAIKNFRKQLNETASWYDWDLEVITCTPDYYKWNQWIFLQFYKNGWAYKKEAPVNWCPSCQTVLANEQVENGKCERCKSPIEKKFLNQWFFKITEFANDLYNDLDKLSHWPERVKIMQKNWIGKSEGSQFKMPLIITNNIVTTFEVFTTRLDTVFGMSYVVFSPEKILELINKGILNEKNLENFKEVKKYINDAINKSELDRTAENKEKTGVELKNFYSINPFNEEKVKVLVSDYVIGSYGTGVVMAVPAHDTRDWEFAKKFNLPIKRVIYPETMIVSVFDIEAFENLENALKEADNNELFYKIDGELLYLWYDPIKKDFFDYWTKKYYTQDIELAKYKFDFEKKEYILQEIISNKFTDILKNIENFNFQENTAYTNKGIVII